MKVKRFLLTNWESYETSEMFRDGVATSDKLNDLVDYILYNTLAYAKSLKYANNKRHRFGIGDNLGVSDLKTGVEYYLDDLVNVFRDDYSYLGLEEYFKGLLEKYNLQIDIENIELNWNGFSKNSPVKFEEEEQQLFIEKFFEKVNKSSMRDIVDLD